MTREEIKDLLCRFFFCYLLAKVIFGTLVWIYLRIIHRQQVNIIGKENIPKHGKVIFYSNHPSIIDQFFILVAGFFPRVIFQPWSLPWSLAAEENFFPPNCHKIPILRRIPYIRNKPLLRLVFQYLAIPVKKSRHDLKA